MLPSTPVNKIFSSVDTLSVVTFLAMVNNMYPATAAETAKMSTPDDR